MALLFLSSSSLCFVAKVFSIFVTCVLLFSWCNSGVLVVCSVIRALATCGICLESLDFSLSLLQIYN